jgi:hypothetical protein
MSELERLAILEQLLLHAERAMALVIVRHKVAKFATWKRAFDGHAPARAEAGFSNVRVYRSADDPSDVVVLLDTDDIGKSKQFIASPELKSAMSAAGVVDKPDVFVLIPADTPGSAEGTTVWLKRRENVPFA